MNLATLILFYFMIGSFKTELPDFYTTPKYYTDLLCTFRSVTDLTKDPSKNQNFNCTCRNEYTSNNSQIKINNSQQQCEYERKSKFTFLFLSITQPLGLELYYIEHYEIFIFCFISGIIIIIGNFYCYFVSDENNYFKSNRNLVFFVLLISLGISWIFKIVYFYTSIDKDGNRIDMLNDVDFSELFE